MNIMLRISYILSKHIMSNGKLIFNLQVYNFLYPNTWQYIMLSLTNLIMFVLIFQNIYFSYIHKITNINFFAKKSLNRI